MSTRVGVLLVGSVRGEYIVVVLLYCFFCSVRSRSFPCTGVHANCRGTKDTHAQPAPRHRQRRVYAPLPTYTHTCTYTKRSVYAHCIHTRIRLCILRAAVYMYAFICVHCLHIHIRLCVACTSAGAVTVQECGSGRARFGAEVCARGPCRRRRRIHQRSLKWCRRRRVRFGCGAPVRCDFPDVV